MVFHVYASMTEPEVTKCNKDLTIFKAGRTWLEKLNISKSINSWNTSNHSWKVLKELNVLTHKLLKKHKNFKTKYMPKNYLSILNALWIFILLKLNPKKLCILIIPIIYNLYIILYYYFLFSVLKMCFESFQLLLFRLLSFSYFFWRKRLPDLHSLNRGSVLGLVYMFGVLKSYDCTL